MGAHFESSAVISGGIDTSGGGPKDSDCGGATNPQPNCLPSSGAVYLFEKRRGNPNIWDAGDFAAFFKAPNAGENDYFGYSVSLNAEGGTLAVGAYNESSVAIAGGIETGDNLKTSDCSVIMSSHCQRLSGAVYLY